MDNHWTDRVRENSAAGSDTPNQSAPSLVEIAIRQSVPMTFEELVKGCTPDEREQLAWHLAQLRARATYERLRRAIEPST